MIIIPMMMAPVASGAIWKWMYSDGYGVINYLLGWPVIIYTKGGGEMKFPEASAAAFILFIFISIDGGNTILCLGKQRENQMYVWLLED